MEYHKIETLYERDELMHRLKPKLILKNRTYGLIKSWLWTEKIDGINIRVSWDVSTGKLTFGGRSDSSQLPADLVRYLYENIPLENVKAVFPEASAVLYGEGYGAGIQKGGGDYSDKKKFILFDALVDGKWWLSWDAVIDVAANLHLDTVPFIGDMTLEDATEKVRAGFKSMLNGGKKQAEGMVGRTAETLFDKKGARLIVKLKTKDF
jgi:RNA ligase